MVNIHAAVVGIPANSTLDDRLRGVGQDVLGWQQRLARMGVAGHRISVTRGATCTRDDVLRAVDALARQLAADPDAAGLLVMAGHGGEHGALLHCADGALTVDQVTTQLDATLPGRGIAAIFDVCPVAQATARPVALRDCDVVLAAAAPGHPAEEVQIDGRWHGAFTWALHRVLDRWASTGPHGALVPISPAILHEQSTLVLRGLGFAQQPTLVGPPSACQAPLMGGDRVVAAPLPAAVTRQVSPDNDSFTVYDLQNGQGTSIGTFVVTGSAFTPTGGYVAMRDYWTTIPTTAFVMVPTTDSLPGTVPNKVYTHFEFDPNGGTSSYNLTPGSGQTLFKLTVGSTIVGYLMRTAGTPVALDWYMTTSPITTYFPTPAGGLTFTPVSSSGSITAQMRSS